MEKLLSIIVPTYNMEQYLCKCLNSLIIPDNILFKKLEVLVINDGSSDSSSKIAHSFENKYSDVFKVIDKNNAHYGSCINVGISIATGKYIKVLDADDYFCTDYLCQFISEIAFIEADLIISDMITIGPKGNILSQEKLSIQEHTKISFDGLVQIYKSISHHNITYRTDLLRNQYYHQTENVAYSDIEWVIKPMISINSAYYIPVCLYSYILGREGQSMSKDARKKSLDSIQTVLISLGHFLDNYNDNQSIKDVLSDRISREIWFVYYGFFIQHIYSSREFARFDQYLISAVPEYKRYTNELVWINHPLFKHPIENWRENRTVIFFIQDVLTRLYVQLSKILTYLKR